MKYLFFLLITFVFFSVLGMKTNILDRWEPGEFSYEDTVFSYGQTKYINVLFYDSRLTPESKLSLDTLSDFLKKNSKLSMQIAVHTDSRGNDKYNLELSKNRARAIVDYVVYKGIDKNRLNYSGAGETELIYSDDYIKKNAKTTQETEAFHQKNRRTVLKITSVNYQKK
jgi:outer membrane protein OmpA-like peptidoglycan-associated protein